MNMNVIFIPSGAGKDFNLVVNYEKASAKCCALDAFIKLECLKGVVHVYLVGCNAATCNKVMTHYHQLKQKVQKDSNCG